MIFECSLCHNAGYFNEVTDFRFLIAVFLGILSKFFLSGIKLSDIGEMCSSVKSAANFFFIF